MRPPSGPTAESYRSMPIAHPTYLPSFCRKLQPYSRIAALRTRSYAGAAELMKDR
uniref:Uncharacterized protein n=1 Tax=uncultured marine virus TaxID=186617 RepID=A0A0F7L4Q1_9VIRU|nr:hypothetical protein [uncultured marine virus]